VVCSDAFIVSLSLSPELPLFMQKGVPLTSSWVCVEVGNPW
jgi:hypothetical protein